MSLGDSVGQKAAQAVSAEADKIAGEIPADIDHLTQSLKEVIDYAAQTLEQFEVSVTVSFKRKAQ